MSASPQTRVLFDSTSHTVSDYSLVNFSFLDQATIQAIGLGPDDVITFEVVTLHTGTSDEYCGCFVKPGQMPSVSGTEVLLCFECDNGNGEAPRPVRLTANNPVVVLNAPQRQMLRAHFDGPGLGTAQVWATLGTSTTNLLPGMDGCPGTCCEDTEWQENGEQRCNLDTDTLERQEISNCGNLRWSEIAPLNWQDTGETRCMEDDECEEPTVREKQQKNDCGDVRWVPDDNPLCFKATTETRCTGLDDPGTDYTLETLYVDECGNQEWRSENRPWIDTREYRCEQDFTDFWTDTSGDFPVPPVAGTVSRKEVTVCGDIRWVYDRAQTWTATGRVKDCRNTTLFEWPNADPILYGFYKYEEVNDCGVTRWVETPKEDETPEWTGKIICSETNDTDVYTTFITRCGDEVTVKLDLVTQDWVDTCCTRCTADGLGTEKQQQNQCGRTRWVAGDPPVFVSTGRMRCVDIEDGEYVVEHHAESSCGKEQWTPESEPRELVDTGATRCEGHLVQRQQTTICGDLVWVDTAEPCGYVPSYPLPEGGWAFRPSDDVDPRATTEIKDCDDNVIAYLYPEPIEGAQTPVLACPDCDGEVLGYAVNGGIPKAPKPAATAVALQTHCGKSYVLWSNGKLTSSGLDDCPALQLQEVQDCDGEPLGFMLPPVGEP